MQLGGDSCPVWPHERFSTAEQLFNLHGAAAGRVRHLQCQFVTCTDMTQPLTLLTVPGRKTDTDIGTQNNWSWENSD